VIEAAALTKQYGGKKVVDQVSLTIAKGKITSLIGPNGAGKSTLLSMISRLIPMDAGQVRVDGADITAGSSKELARKLSILKQSNHLNVRLTVEELVGFGRFPYSQGKLTKEDHLKVDEAIRYLELEPFRRMYLDQLSGGQRQRAFIAMVLAQDTEYVLLDEPLNNLDMKHSVQIMKVLKQIVRDFGKTIVLVLHDINFASCYSDDIVAMKDGKVVKAGTTQDMITPEVLAAVYDMDIQVEEVGGSRVCYYYT